MDDAWYHILSKLPINEKIRLERVCKQWKAVLNAQLKCMQVIDTADALENVPAKKLMDYLMAVLDRCSKRVRTFRFRKYRGLEIDDKLLDKLFSKCIYLRSFETKNAFITHQALSLFDQIPSGIEKFRLKYCLLDTINPEITRYAIKKMLQRCSALRQFAIVGIGSCHGYLVIDDDLLMHLSNNVQALSTSAGDSLKLDTVEFSKKLARLEAFDARHSPLPNSSLQQLALNCPSIKRLDISYSLCLNDFSPILRLKYLRDLRLKGTQLTDQCLSKIIANCTNLKRLNLSSCGRLTEPGLRQLSKSKSIQYLDISAMNAVTDSVISEIARGCIALQHIDFSFCPRVSFHGLNNLTLLPKLRRVIGDGIELQMGHDPEIPKRPRIVVQ